MPNRATLPIHCTKPCKDVSLNMPFRKQKFTLLSPYLLPIVAQLYVTGPGGSSENELPIVPKL